MFIPSDASSATQPNWLHLVISANGNFDSPDNHPRYGVYKVCPAAPDKMLPLDGSSGMSPEQLVAVKNLSHYLSELERVGLCVGCCCQLSEQSSAAESTAGLERVVTAEHPIEHPLAEPLTVSGDIQSEPAASEPTSSAEPVSPVFGAASTPCPEPNPTALSIQLQIDQDLALAYELQGNFNRELIDQCLQARLSSKTQPVESRRDAAGGSNPIRWNTNCHYGDQV